MYDVVYARDIIFMSNRRIILKNIDPHHASRSKSNSSFKNLHLRCHALLAITGSCDDLQQVKQPDSRVETVFPYPYSQFVHLPHCEPSNLLPQDKGSHMKRRRRAWFSSAYRKLRPTPHRSTQSRTLKGGGMQRRTLHVLFFLRFLSRKVIHQNSRWMS